MKLEVVILALLRTVSLFLSDWIFAHLLSLARRPDVNIDQGTGYYTINYAYAANGDGDMHDVQVDKTYDLRRASLR